MSEIRPVLPEIKYFLLYLLSCVQVRRVQLASQSHSLKDSAARHSLTLRTLHVFIPFFSFARPTDPPSLHFIGMALSAQQKKLLNLFVHSLSFLRNFEFQESVQYCLR